MVHEILYCSLTLQGMAQAARLVSQAEVEAPQQGRERRKHVDARQRHANAMVVAVAVRQEALDLHVHVHVMWVH